MLYVTLATRRWPNTSKYLTHLHLVDSFFFCASQLVVTYYFLYLIYSITGMEKKEEELEQLKMDCEHFRARLEAAQADCMREKKVYLLVVY